MYDMNKEDAKDLVQMLDGKEIPEAVKKRYFDVMHYYNKRSGGQRLGLVGCAMILRDVLSQVEENEDVDVLELKPGDPVMFTWKNSKPRKGKFHNWCDDGRVQVEEEDGTIRTINRKFLSLPEAVGV